MTPDLLVFHVEAMKLLKGFHGSMDDITVSALMAA
jgi:hypothetical protein